MAGKRFLRKVASRLCRYRFLRKVASRLCRYHAGQKFRSNRSILLCLRGKCVFAFNAEIQEGRQKWLENQFCEKSPVALKIPCGSKILSKSLDLPLPLLEAISNVANSGISSSVSEINRFLRLMQKFKMATKSQISCQPKISSKSLYHAPFPR